MSKTNFLTDSQLSKINPGTLTRVFNAPAAIDDVIEIPADAQVGPREWKDGNNEARQYFVFDKVIYNEKPRVEKSTSFLRSGNPQIVNAKTVEFFNKLAMLNGLEWLKAVRGTKWQCIHKDKRQDRNGNEFDVFTWELVA